MTRRSVTPAWPVPRAAARRVLAALLALALALASASCGSDHQPAGASAPQPWLEPPTFLRAVGQEGLTVHYLYGLTAGGERDVWVAQGSPARLWHFDLDGRLLQRVDYATSAPDLPYLRPGLLAVAPDGTLWMIDSGYDRLHHLNARGDLLASFGDETDPRGALGYLTGLVVNDAGQVFVLDASGCRVVVFGADGARLRTFGRRCPGDCGFEEPVGIALAPGGDILVLDADDARVKRYHPDGTFASSWGVPGWGPGELNDPTGLSIGADGRIHLLDRGGRRIQIFTAEGDFVRAVTVEVGCEPGGPPGLRAPLVIEPGGDYLAIDRCATQVQRMTPEGRRITAFSGADPDAYSVGQVEQLVVDGRGHMFTVDREGHVLELDAAGTRVRERGPFEDIARGVEAPVGRLALDGQGYLYGAFGYEPRVLRMPLAGGPIDTLELRQPGDLDSYRTDALAVDPGGRLFVALGSGQIRVFDADARLLEIRLLAPPEDMFGLPAIYGRATDLRIGPDGGLWALDATHHRIVRWDAQGNPAGETRFAAEGIESIRSPASMAPAPGGYFDVLNGANGKIYRFGPDGHYLFRWSPVGAVAGRTCAPQSIAWDGAGRLLVADAWCERISIYAY